MTNSHDESLRPEEFAEAAAAAIADAQSHDFSTMASVLAEAGSVGVCAPEDDGGLNLSLAFAVPIAQQAGKLRLRFPLVEQVLVARHWRVHPKPPNWSVATVLWQLPGKVI